MQRCVHCQLTSCHYLWLLMLHQEMFLATSADKQTLNYDTECSNHHPSQSPQETLGLSHSKMKY